MNVFEAWVGNCILRDCKDGMVYKCQVAAWADGHLSYRAGVEAAIFLRNLTLLSIENACSASNVSQLAPEALALTQVVHAGHPVEIGGMTHSCYEHSDIPNSFLNIVEHPIESLSDQSDLPIWEQDWIAPELRELLFGQPRNDEMLRTYCIINAGARKAITKIFDVEEDSLDVPVRCLFKGEAEETLEETAPYLVDATLTQSCLDGEEHLPRFHKTFFQKHWGKNTGIFMRTTLPMEAVWQHFRKFTKVIVEEDSQKVFFLFYDPRVLSSYLRNISNNEEKVRSFCTTNTDSMFSFFIENGDHGVIEARPYERALMGQSRARLSLSYNDFRLQSDAEKQKRVERIALRIKEDFPEELKNWPLNDLTIFSLRILERFRLYGFSSQEYVHFFVAWSVFFGEGFETRDPHGMLQKICYSKVDEDQKFLRFKERFDQFVLNNSEGAQC